MKSPRSILVLLAAALTACGSEPADHGVSVTGQPLCDGSPGARLSSLVGGGQVDQDYEFHGVYGHWAFVIDGQCRYWAAAAPPMQGLRTGTLTAAEGTDIARQLHWGAFASLARNRDTESCPDAGDSLIGDGTNTINCTCGCEGAPAAIREAFARVQAIHDRLQASGASYDGPLRAFTLRRDPVSVPRNQEILPWSLSSSPAELLHDGPSLRRDSGKLVEAAADRAALRALRAMATAGRPGRGFFVRAGGGEVFEVHARDEAPAHVLAGLAALR